MRAKLSARVLLAIIVVALNFLIPSRSAAQTWVTNSPLAAARWRHTATLLPNGEVLIAGGILYNVDGNFQDTNGAELYDPDAGMPAAAASMQDNRNSHTATLLPGGQVLVTGGGGDASSEVYDPDSDSWIDFANMNDERIDHSAVLLPNGQVLAIAGYDDGNGNELSSSELYDPGSQTWTYTGSLPYATDSGAAVLLQNGQVLYCGGSDGGGGRISNAAIYDPLSQTWANINSMNEPRANHTATLLPNGKVLVVGGTYLDNSAEIFDPAVGTWTYVATSLDGHIFTTSVLLNDGQVMVMGDDSPNVELYDPINDDWNYTDFLPVAGNFQTATVLQGGQVLVTGGGVSQFNGPPEAVIETYGDPVFPPTLTVTVTPSGGSAPLTVQFSSPSVDSDGNTVTSWSWSFGDGGSSTAQNPSHTYQQLGAFTPDLTAFSDFGPTPLSVSGPGTINLTDFGPSPGSWTLTGSLTNGVKLTAAVLLHNGKVLLAGGEDHNFTPTANAELYDQRSNAWTVVQPLISARFGHTATVLTNGVVLVVGGTTNADDPSTVVQTVELFNPTNSTWTTTGPLHFPRFLHTATLLPSGKVLVAGGVSGAGNFAANSFAASYFIGVSEVYDPATGLWTTNGLLNVARCAHTATLLPGGEVLVAGGISTNSSLETDVAELYNPANGLWTITGTMPTPVGYHAAVLCPDGTVLVTGGDVVEGFGISRGFVPVTFAQSYDPNTALWSSLPDMAHTHDHHTATVLTNGLVLVAGGNTNSAELYAPNSQTWFPAAFMNVPRYSHSAVLLTNGLVLAVGGVGIRTFVPTATAELYSDLVVSQIILVHPTWLGSAFQFNFANTPGAGSTVYATTNLAISFANWTNLGSATEISSGQFQFTDLHATNSLRRFYRVSSP